MKKSQPKTGTRTNPAARQHSAGRRARAAGSTAPYVPQIRLYQNWLAEQRGLRFDSYEALWRWSTVDLDAFWQSIWDCFGVQSPTPAGAVLADARMPGAKWFAGAQPNYVRQVLRHVDAAHAAGLPAIVSGNEGGDRREMSWPELRRQVASFALHLKSRGVGPGDRVAAWMPNIPETVVAFLACASLGAVWSVCAPDMGLNAVLDRFAQIGPKVLIGVDGVRYNGREIDLMQRLAELRAKLPTVQHTILHGNLDARVSIAGYDDLASACGRNDAQTAAFEPLALPFDHPIWIVYSSGTTGLPKAIVHGHGGVLLVALAQGALHEDIGCSYAENSFGERFHWYSSTGWVMWNSQVSGLLSGTTICIFDGNPAAKAPGGDRPDWGTLWRFAAETGVTFFGAGAAFYANCMKAGIDLSSSSQCGDLRQVRALGTTGSPLAAEVQNWGVGQFRKLGTPEIWWCNISGGTDFVAAVATGNCELQQVAGQMQCRGLGCAVEAWNEQGKPVIDEVGELVLTRPLPSMPLYFWGDAGNARYLASYFDVFPGVWRHGDWIKIGHDGGCTIYGRSDATINRHGLRMGTSELYSAVEALDEVIDSLVVDLEHLGRESYMPLFVVLREGLALDAALEAKINGAIRDALSPRFVPNDVLQVAQIPRTISGKKQELPIKKLLLGQPVEKVVNREAMANPDCLDWYVAFAARRAADAAHRLA